MTNEEARRLAAYLEREEPLIASQLYVAIKDMAEKLQIKKPIAIAALAAGMIEAMRAENHGGQIALVRSFNSARRGFA